MQKVFNLTNKYIILATPLILYSLLSQIYMVFVISGGKILNIILAFGLYFLMLGAFIAGWFNMIKLAVSTPERDEPYSLIKEFLGGVGEYFLPALGAIFVIGVITLITLVITYLVGFNTIGDIGISQEVLSKAFQSQEAAKAFMLGLNQEQLIKINLWNLIILGFMSIGGFLLMLYLPALFFKSKNPILAFFMSIKDLFSKKFGKTLGVFLLIILLNFLFSIFSVIFSKIIFMHFIITLLNFYITVVVGVGIFYYYYNNFVKPLLGQNVDIEV